MICLDPERRSIFPPEVRAQATALACSLPKEEKVALSRWSLAEIVKRLQALQIASAISISTVWRRFRADRLKPWQFHNWQHILKLCTKQVDFVTRGIEGYLSLPQGWLIWVVFSWLPAAIITKNYSPDPHFGMVLITSYGLASVVYVVLRILVENWLAEWQVKQ